MKVYLALIRPKLKRGAEWKLTSVNGMFALLMLVTALTLMRGGYSASRRFSTGRVSGYCARRLSMTRSGWRSTAGPCVIRWSANHTGTLTRGTPSLAR
jgi:hypothetical protein